MTRELRVTVSSQRDPLDPIPIELFTRTLNALRNATCHAGEMLVGADERDRGRFGGQVAEHCRLVITELSTGSATAAVALPILEQPRLVGPDEHGEDMAELGERAVAMVFAVSEALSEPEEDHQVVRRLLPDSATDRQRARFFSDIAEMSPLEKEGAVVTIAPGADAAQSYQLTSDVRRRAQSLANPVRARGIETQERTIMGELVELRVKTKTHFGIEHGDDEFVCPYDEEFLDILRENLGKTVSLRGLFRVRPQTDDDDEILDLVELIDVQPVDTRPLVLQSVEWGSRSITFRRPITIPVNIEFDTVLLAIEDLHVFSCGDSLREASADLAEQVVWVWDTYGQRPDEELSPDAQIFKRKVRGILTEGEAS